MRSECIIPLLGNCPEEQLETEKNRTSKSLTLAYTNSLVMLTAVLSSPHSQRNGMECRPQAQISKVRTLCSFM